MKIVLKETLSEAINDLLSHLCVCLKSLHTMQRVKLKGDQSLMSAQHVLLSMMNEIRETTQEGQAFPSRSSRR